MTPEEQLPVEKDHIADMFTRLDDLQANASVDAVFGQPVTVGDKTIIPVAHVTYGFGLGFGEGIGREGRQTDVGLGGGAGGGVGAKPLGVIEITPERTHIEPIVDEQKLALAGFALGAWSIFWTARAVMRILRR